MGNWIYFGAQCCQKYALHQKKVQMKVVWKWISYKKDREHICLSRPRVELGVFKDQYIWNLIMYRKWKSPLAPLWEGTDMYAHWLFVQNSISNNFHLKFFLMYCVFFGSTEPQSESNSPFLYIKRLQIY